jgi:hypothetical protein
MSSFDLCCGFECGASSALNNNHWNLGTAASFNTTANRVRSGVRSLRSNPTAQNSATQLGSNTYGSRSTNVWRIYVWFDSLPTSDSMISACWTSTTLIAYGVAYKSSDGKLYAAHQTSAGAFTFGATGVTATTGAWIRLDIRVVSSNPQSVDAQVDGVALGTAANAVAGVSFQRQVMGICCSGTLTSTGDAYFDDFVRSFDGADYPIGAGYVNHFTPVSDGAHNIAGANDFERSLTGTDILNSTTDAYLLVSKVPLSTSITDFINMIAPPSATDYVECVIGPASGVSTPTTGPRVVTALATIHQAGTGTGNMQIRLMDGATASNIYSATTVAGTVTITFQGVTLQLAPSTGAAWTAALFNALRVQFGSPAALDVNPDQYFDGLILEAEFEEVPVVFIPHKPIVVGQAVRRSATY